MTFDDKSTQAMGGQIMDPQNEIDAILTIKKLISGTGWIIEKEENMSNKLPAESTLINPFNDKKVSLKITTENPWKQAEKNEEFNIRISEDPTKTTVWVLIDNKIFKLSEAKSMVPKILRDK